MKLSANIAYLAAASLSILLSVPIAVAEEPVNLPQYEGTTLTPFYDPASKSYLQQVNVAHGPQIVKCAHISCRWDEAAPAAEGLVYKGVHGRLAVIKSMATQEFLLTHFTFLQAIWIGLRYFCNSGKLQWVDGEYMERSDFAAWDKQWDQSADLTNGGCSSYNDKGFLGVAMSSKTQGGTWFAKESHKFFVQFFVQYSTGKP